MEYLALGDGSPGFPQSGMFRGTQVSLNRQNLGFRYGAVTLYGCLFHGIPVPRFFTTGAFRTPSATLQHRVRNALRLTRKRFRLFPFRSPLLRESLLFSLPGVTKMFQFAPFPSCPYEFRTG